MRKMEARMVPMKGYMPASPAAETTDALARAMVQTGYVPAANQDEFVAIVAADVLIRQLRQLGYEIKRILKTQTTATDE
jgi:replicative DNA helicase